MNSLLSRRLDAAQIRPLLNELILFYENSSPGVVRLSEEYTIKKRWDFHQVGEWRAGGRGLRVPVPNVWERRANLRGAILKNAVLELSVVTRVQYNDYGKLVGAIGLFQDMLDYLKKKLNFSVKTVTPSDSVWGTRQKNGEWTGIVGMLLEDAADISTAGRI